MKVMNKLAIGAGSAVVFVVLVMAALAMIFMINPVFIYVETGQIRENLYTVKGTMGNFYLYKSSDGWLAFDAGDSVKDIPNELKKIGIDPLDITHVFLTHSDKDHIAGVPLFTNAVVALSSLEVQMIDGTTARAPFLRNSLPIDRYMKLNDSESMTIGDTTVAFYSTPGHTPGSMCFLINDKILVSGDTLMLKKGSVKPFVRKFSMDRDTMIRSIRDLAGRVKPEIICTGHTGYTLDAESALRNWR
jgi:hydroxyacylglutathione hydrolase